MKRNHGQSKRYPGFYRWDFLDVLRESAGLSVRKTAIKARVNQDTARRVFKGTASQKQVWPIAQFFKVDWKVLHDLELPLDDFHRVVLGGDPSSMR